MVMFSPSSPQPEAPVPLLPRMVAWVRALRPGLLLVLAVTVTSFSGCGSHWPGHTPPGVYTVPVTARWTPVSVNTQAAISHTVNIKLTVTP